MEPQGSHDSFSFWVDEKAPVGPDQKAIVKYLATAFRFVSKKVMKKWSMTQNLTFKEQLDAGIRYFDLREVFGSKLCKISVVEDITLDYLWKNNYQFLETTLGERAKKGSFHVTQAILTPRVKTIVKGLVRGLRNYLVERNLPIILTWVETQKPGVNGVNIITSDFVELTDFANTVINLNNLLLNEQDRTKT
ncbi:unnamed protein product [Coregonus sp. 'balchen']|nr:unnamed protein product [Coregonus sp. 'balchen']